MKNFISLFLFLNLIQIANATNYYVSPNGNDAKDGKSLANAFATIQKGHDVSMAGDTIFVADGTYKEEVKITRSGNSTSDIMYKSINKFGAKVLNTWYNCFTVKASYITIDGFELIAPSTYGSGVGAMPTDAPVRFNHHITIRNNKCHDSGQGGIGAQDCDYITIENNICYKNSWIMPYCGSGISIYGRSTFDTEPGFHYIVRGNICYLNDNGPATNLTDGNGIIIDDLRNTQTENHHGLAQSLTYTTQAVLVENNLCYANGGKGIHLAWSNNVTIRNNTVYGNCTRADQANSTWNGDLSLAFTSNCIAINNICVSTVPNYNAHGIFAGSTSGIGASSKLSFYNNIAYCTFDSTLLAVYSEGVSISFAGNNDNKTATNPMLIDPANSNTPDFHLKSESPAINSGSSAYGNNVTDLDGNTRVVETIDRGAYEFGGTPVVTGIIEPTKNIISAIYSAGILTISNLPNETCIAFLYNLDGRLVTYFSISGSGELNVGQIPGGIYILRVIGRTTLYNLKMKL